MDFLFGFILPPLFLKKGEKKQNTVEHQLAVSVQLASLMLSF